MLNNWASAQHWSAISKLLLACVVLTTLLASTGIIYFTGGTEGRFHALAHLYYIPIVVAALSFGPAAGVLTGLTAALLGGPIMPANVTLQVMQPVSDWLTRAFFFVLIGGTVSALTGQLRAALKAERRQREQLNVLHEIDKAILTDQSLDRLFRQIVEAVGALFEAEVCCLYLLDEESGRLVSESCWTRSGAQPDALLGMPAATEAVRRTEAIAGLAYSRREVVTCPDLLEDTSLPDSNQRDFERLGLRSVMAAPLANSEQGAGALLVGYAEPRQFSREHQTDLARVTHQAAIALKNGRQLEQLSQFGHETLAAFTEAIAQRDLYTGGHINRITGYALAMAQRLNLPRDQIETTRYAAQLHDIGKVAIPTDILRKPGSLSQREWDIIRQHPDIGSQILERISVLRDAAPLVRYHHEHYDGSGYPAGLSGDEIPLGARIIAVADAFDAMISDRPYRPALSFREAIAELEVHAGTQFDPNIIATFLKVLDIDGHRDSSMGLAVHAPFRSSNNSPASNVVNGNGQRDVDVE